MSDLPSRKAGNHAPDKREVGSSTLPSPIYDRCKDLTALRRFRFGTDRPFLRSVGGGPPKRGALPLFVGSMRALA
jgi:hypothetical protein